MKLFDCWIWLLYNWWSLQSMVQTTTTTQPPAKHLLTSRPSRCKNRILLFWCQSHPKGLRIWLGFQTTIFQQKKCYSWVNDIHGSSKNCGGVLCFAFNTRHWWWQVSWQKNPSLFSRNVQRNVKLYFSVLPGQRPWEQMPWGHRQNFQEVFLGESFCSSTWAFVTSEECYMIHM